MTNTQPKVSILVTTYQHGRLIEQCLQSLLAQKTNFPYEIVIGEDGSTDGTLETCQTYAKKYPDIIRLFVRDQRKKVYLYGKPPESTTCCKPCWTGEENISPSAKVTITGRIL